MLFADKVKIVRDKENISQEKLAVILGVSFATINRWENGRANPSFLAQEKFNAYCKEHSIKFEDE